MYVSWNRIYIVLYLLSDLYSKERKKKWNSIVVIHILCFVIFVRWMHLSLVHFRHVLNHVF